MEYLLCALCIWRCPFLLMRCSVELDFSGLILGFHPATGRRCYFLLRRLSLAGCTPIISPASYILQERLESAANLYIMCRTYPHRFNVRDTPVYLINEFSKFYFSHILVECIPKIMPSFRASFVRFCVLPDDVLMSRPVSLHYSDVMMSTRAYRITSLTIVYSNVYWGANQIKHQSSITLRGIHRWPVNAPHKGPVTRKTFPFDAVIIGSHTYHHQIVWKRHYSAEKWITYIYCQQYFTLMTRQISCHFADNTFNCIFWKETATQHWFR